MRAGHGPPSLAIHRFQFPDHSIDAQEPAPEFTFLQHLGANLRSGLRVAFFLPLQFRTDQASWLHVLVLTALDLVFQFVLDFQRIGSAGYFAPAGIAGALFGLPVIVIAATLAAGQSGKDDVNQRIIRFATSFSALTIVIDIASNGALLLVAAPAVPPEWSQVLTHYAFYATIAWLSLSSATFVWRESAGTPCGRGTLATLAALCMGVPWLLPERDATLWRATQTEARHSVDDKARIEQALHRQQELLARHWQAIAPRRTGAVNLYFVGFAGSTQEEVFKREILSVAALLNQRFDTAGRSVVLSNHPDTLEEFPAATSQALAETLKRIGMQMNRDEDILLLYLTSHGSPDWRISVDFAGLALNELTPQGLRRSLDQSGIKNRIVIISACYSGGFIDALQDEHTLVITAAAPDRYSFGCHNENDFTYFGQAYFDHALRQTHSFIEAFDIARDRIEKRETAAGYQPSRPQIRQGNGLRGLLARLEKQLSAPRSP